MNHRSCPNARPARKDDIAMTIPVRKTLTVSAVSLFLLATALPSSAGNLLLFPYINTTDNVYTFISLFHDPHDANGAEITPDRFNPSLRIGATTNSVTVDGQEYQGCITMRYYYQLNQPGTLRQWEAAGRFDLPNDFGDAPPAISASFPAGKEGYMIIESGDESATVLADESGQIYGEATIIDTAGGTVLSYAALRLSASHPRDFAVLGGREFASSWLPRAVAGTSWYVLPLGALIEKLPGLRPDAAATRLGVATDPDSPGAYGRQGRYQTIGANTRNIHCFATVTLDDIAPVSALQMGGWFTLASSRPALIWKIEHSGEFGSPVTTMHALTRLR